jgi:hypothetical protein
MKMFSDKKKKEKKEQHTKKFEDTKGQIRSHVVQRMVDNTMGNIGQKDNGQQNKYYNNIRAKAVNIVQHQMSYGEEP